MAQYKRPDPADAFSIHVDWHVVVFQSDRFPDVHLSIDAAAPGPENGIILFPLTFGKQYDGALFVRPTRCALYLRSSFVVRGNSNMASPIQSKQDLIDRLRAHGSDLRQLGVERIGVFGSFQRDEPDAGSDVDLLVDFVPGEKSFDHFMELSFMLEEELGRTVELVTRESLSPHLGPSITDSVEYVEIGD